MRFHLHTSCRLCWLLSVGPTSHPAPFLLPIPAPSVPSPGLYTHVGASVFSLSAWQLFHCSLLLFLPFEFICLLYFSHKVKKKTKKTRAIKLYHADRADGLRPGDVRCSQIRYNERISNVRGRNTLSFLTINKTKQQSEWWEAWSKR